jgi:hypothetical protein
MTDRLDQLNLIPTCMNKAVKLHRINSRVLHSVATHHVAVCVDNTNEMHYSCVCARDLKDEGKINFMRPVTVAALFTA